MRDKQIMRDLQIMRDKQQIMREKQPIMLDKQQIINYYLHQYCADKVFLCFTTHKD